MKRDVGIQRAYYARTANSYNSMHVSEEDEHAQALLFLSAVIDYMGASSVLDIGSGTGRALLHLKKRRPDLRVLGIEPSPELREIGHAAGLAQSELIDGDATNLGFSADDFDIVCEFGALHHIRDHSRATTEMARVARLGVFISDANNFGIGGPGARFTKRLIYRCGLWPAFDFIKTKGKRYYLSEGDGLAYSYSAFYSIPLLREKFSTIQMLNTSDVSSSNLFNAASHVAIFAHNGGS